MSHWSANIILHLYCSAQEKLGFFFFCLCVPSFVHCCLVLLPVLLACFSSGLFMWYIYVFNEYESVKVIATRMIKGYDNNKSLKQDYFF